MTPPAADGGDARGLALISSAVAQMVVPILIGVWLDNRYGWSPWGMAAGAMIGVVGGAWSLRAVYRRMNRNNKPGGASPSEN